MNLAQFHTPGNKQTSFRSTKKSLKLAEKIKLSPSITYFHSMKGLWKDCKKACGKIWENLGIFNPIQFGFLEGKSTVTQLLTCNNDWASSRNKSTRTDVVFLDFTKAFDSVPHERLLLKLKLVMESRVSCCNGLEIFWQTWHLLLVDPC